MNLTAIQSKVTRGNYVNVKKSVILSAEKEQPAENKVTGQQSEVTRPVHTIVSDSSAANPVPGVNCSLRVSRFRMME